MSKGKTAKKRKEQPEGFLAFIIDVAINSVVIIIIFLIVQQFVAAPFQVSGSSMKSTLIDDEYIVITKLGYTFGNPERGDIVVFNPPNNEEEYYIKRIIGIPGDTVHLKKGQVFVNGHLLEENYLDEGMITCLITHAELCSQDSKVYSVPEGGYFVLGDNRNGSSDSRKWRDENNRPIPFITKDHIQGKAQVVIYPLPALRLISETEVFSALEPAGH